MVKHLNILHQEIIEKIEQEHDPVAALSLVIDLTLSYFQQHQGLIKLFFMQIGYENKAAIEQLQDARQTYRNILNSIIVRNC